MCHEVFMLCGVCYQMSSRLNEEWFNKIHLHKVVSLVVFVT